MVSMLSTLVKSRSRVHKIAFLWTFRGRSVFRMLQPLIAPALGHKSVSTEMRLFDSHAASVHPLVAHRVNDDGESEPLLAQQEQHHEEGRELEQLIKTGRPNLRREIESAMCGTTFVYCCGPPLFVAEVHGVAMLNGLPVHQETFLF
jgi:hypothetical protein